MKEVRIREPHTVSAHLSALHDFPPLEKEEEYRLAKEWQETGRRESIDRIVKSHLRLVRKIAHGYRGYGLLLEDLIAEGSIGILQAASRFDPERGFRFSTYAQWWIKASMQDYILRSWSLVKFNTRATYKKLFFSLNRVKTSLDLAGQRRLSDADLDRVAREMEVPSAHLREVEQRLSAADFSLNTPYSTESEAGEWQDYMEDPSENPEEVTLNEQEQRYRHALLTRALKCLTPREYKILHLRRLSETPLSLESIAQQIGLSRERVRQIEQSAFRKLQRAVRESGRDQPRTSVLSFFATLVSGWRF
ncbi:MAG: RNA polymerase factor sigma-32 [Holosporales bacterium]|nr:RNA polymerase factor sigma-32 [Holosporales bacterium]